MNEQFGTLQKNNLKAVVVIVCVVIGIFGRVLPHFPNITPTMSLSLFMGSMLRRVMACFILIATLVISDILLSFFYGYPIFGFWTFFVYSGFIVTTFCGKALLRHFSWVTFPLWIICTSLFYWIWTNFGVWLSSGMYHINFEGLCSCYIAAVPFLWSSLVGDFIWGTVFFGAYNTVCWYNRCNQERVFPYIRAGSRFVLCYRGLRSNGTDSKDSHQ